MVRGPKGCSRLALSRAKRGLGAAPDPIFLLCQGDRGAPGELGETGEKVRWCWSGTVPFGSVGRSSCPHGPVVAVPRSRCQSPVVSDGI